MASHIPHLVDIPDSKQLVVNGKPFLMLAGELQNSSLSSSEYMDSVWQKLVDQNFNTILGAVTWETIEPTEGHFNFDDLDKVILGARKHKLHLVLLRFGSFKNALSTYAPSWVKTDPTRFPRAKLRKAGGILQTADALSIFHPNAKEADAKAFSKLISHIKEVDEEHSTVIMVQVENEIGILGDSRDASTLAEDAFAAPVPEDLVDFLKEEWETLHPDLKANLTSFRSGAASRNSQDNWETVFGKGPRTDEIFMAYHYAQYINYITEVAKKEYALPFYTNVWLNYSRDDVDAGIPIVVGGGVQPGEYPSGGGTSNVLDIWQRFTPSLEFIAPDIYITNYDNTCAKYRHRNQPLFIPEQRRDAYGARRAWAAIGSHAALGTSPFGVDTIDVATSAFLKPYGLLSSVADIILKAQTWPGSMKGFFFDEVPESGPDTAIPIAYSFGGYEITIDRAFVFGKPAPGEGIIIHQSAGRFLLIGGGFSVKARALNPDATFTGILRFEEMTPEGCSPGELRALRSLNGDETRGGIVATMPNDDPDYGDFPICVTIPAETNVAEVEFYYLEEGKQ